MSSPEVRPSSELRFNLPAIVATGGSILTALVLVGGLGVGYVSSKIKAEDGIDVVNQRLIEIQMRLDHAAATIDDLTARLIRLEENQKFVNQTLAEIKLATIPKR